MDVKQIRPSERDRQVLDRLVTTRKIVERQQPKDYRNCVVMKPWGYEYLIFENEHVAVWFLKIYERHATSMHCHPLKKTALVLLAGKALCNTLQNRNYLNSLSGLIIEKSVFHSTKALSPGGIELIEIETPPNKTDLVRLDDTYGRECHGYEGFSEMETEGLRRFDHFYFEELFHQGQTHVAEKFSLSLESYGDPEHFRNLQIMDDEILSPCRGRFLTGHGEVVADVGEAHFGRDLKMIPGLTIQGKTTLLRARAKNIT